MLGAQLEAQLDGLLAMPPAELREEWARRFDALSPNVSAELLRLGIAYRMQEQRLGGLSRETRSLLKQQARSDPAANEPNPLLKLSVGTKLVRDWHGVGHTVTVIDNGFEYDGKTWRSHTAIAKAITGSHRNGPRFFGLRGS